MRLFGSSPERPLYGYSPGTSVKCSAPDKMERRLLTLAIGVVLSQQGRPICEDGRIGAFIECQHFTDVWPTNVTKALDRPFVIYECLLCAPRVAKRQIFYTEKAPKSAFTPIENANFPPFFTEYIPPWISQWNLKFRGEYIVKGVDSTGYHPFPN